MWSPASAVRDGKNVPKKDTHKHSHTKKTRKITGYGRECAHDLFFLTKYFWVTPLKPDSFSSLTGIQRITKLPRYNFCSWCFFSFLKRKKRSNNDFLLFSLHSPVSVLFYCLFKSLYLCNIRILSKSIGCFRLKKTNTKLSVLLQAYVTFLGDLFCFVICFEPCTFSEQRKKKNNNLCTANFGLKK